MKKQNDVKSKAVKANANKKVHEDSVLETKGQGKTQKVKKKAVARKDMTMLQWTWHEIKRNKIAYVMIAPFMIVFILFTVVPVGLSLLLSFTNFNMLEVPDIIWIDNYTRLFFDDEIFLLACKNTLIFAAVTGPVSYVLSFLVAWFINELSPRKEHL